MATAELLGLNQLQQKNAYRISKLTFSREPHSGITNAGGGVFPHATSHLIDAG